MTFRAIHQMVPYLGAGDAIGNHVLALQQLFRSWGYASEIFAPGWAPSVQSQVLPCRTYARYSHADNLLVLHYAIGSEVNAFARQQPDHLVLYYHNITPAHFFFAFDGELALQLEEGRRGLAAFAGRTPAIAGSDFNARELQAMGIEVVGVVPYAFALEQHTASHNGVPLEFSQRYARADSVDWLSVGRLVPNKRLEDVIKAFYYYHAWINSGSRLFLVGNGQGSDQYLHRLTQLINRLKLNEAVIFTGAVAHPAPFYELAQVYVTMSEHEGFCVPLLEAMHHGLPIVAYASTAVPETLGGTGVLIHRKNHAVIAEVVNELLCNPDLRSRVVAGQRARLAAFTPAQAGADLRACLERLSQSAGGR
jgi:glycosyltransferase involved in cell wall biosynthesis